MKFKENSNICGTMEKEHLAEMRIKFPHGCYDLQAAIQVFHETLLTESCHYVRSSLFICNSNQRTSFCILTTLR